MGKALAVLVGVVVVVATLVEALFAVSVTENLVSVFGVACAVLAGAFLVGHAVS